VAPVIARSPFVPASEDEVFNVGADEPSTVLDLAHIIAEAFGVEPQIDFRDARNEVVHAFSDHSKIQAAFDLPEPVSLRDGIGRMADWVRRHGSREPVEFAAGIEVMRNLPPSWRTVAPR
jgi:UDP-glucose 4-epimerase